MYFCPCESVGWGHLSSARVLLSIGCTFDETECNGEWREFGIFGGNATADKDSGFMIDKKHHSVFTKTEDIVVDRRLYLTISF